MVCTLVSIYFDSPQIGKLCKTLDYLSRHMPNFDFLEKKFGNSFSTIFCVWFFKKSVLLCYILLTDDISLSDCLCLLRYFFNMCIVIACFPGCDVISFEINLIFLIKLFFNMTKKSRQKNWNILRIKRAFRVK